MPCSRSADPRRHPLAVRAQSDEVGVGAPGPRGGLLADTAEHRGPAAANHPERLLQGEPGADGRQDDVGAAAEPVP